MSANLCANDLLLAQRVTVQGAIFRAMQIKMSDTLSTEAATSDVPTAPTSPPVSNGKTALADDFRTHFAGDAPLAEKAKGFAKARPWTSAAFIGVAALAVLNTLRGRASR